MFSISNNCIYTIKIHNFFNLKEVHDSTERPKINVSSWQDTAKNYRSIRHMQGGGGVEKIVLLYQGLFATFSSYGGSFCYVFLIMRTLFYHVGAVLLLFISMVGTSCGLAPPPYKNFCGRP